MISVTVATLLFGLVGLLFVGLSIPLIRNGVPRNRFYGFRTAKTMSDAKIWYEVNHISGIDLFLAGVLISVTSVTLFVIGQNWKTEHVSLTLLLVMVFSLTGVAWHGYRVMKSM